MTHETTTKLKRVSAFLDRHNLGAVMLWNRNNFAWLTGGRDNHIGRASPSGVAGLIATKAGKLVCVTNTIEAPRFRDEELLGLSIDVIDYPWHDPHAGAKAIGDLLAGATCASDITMPGLDLSPLPDDFAQLRWQLNRDEIDRYRLGGRLASEAMESACHSITPGMSEKEIAAILDHEVHVRGGHPVVTLIAADERLAKFRHPIPTMKRFERVVMLVICSEYKGLISNLTRIVHAGDIGPDDRAKIQAVADIDTAVNLATKPGRPMGEVFTDLQKAYAKAGYADQWKLHHQGGSTGYAGREVFANPTSDVRVLSDQAFAWNPSIVGCKAEDTVLITDAGIEVLTPHSPSWPSVEGTSDLGTLRRAGWLEI